MNTYLFQETYLIQENVLKKYFKLDSFKSL